MDVVAAVRVVVVHVVFWVEAAAVHAVLTLVVVISVRCLMLLFFL